MTEHFEGEAISQALELHKRHGGKITIASRVDQLDAQSLAQYYTPGVADVSRHLAEQPQDMSLYTAPARAVAVVSDGSAVLGLGNVGPEAAMPVMEGKALLFKELAGLDAWPIVLSTQDPDEIVAAVTAIAPGFGGINLEDIAAPQCFEIERRLKESLKIPVVHDDQHATAIVVLAGLINALKIVGKTLDEISVVINGAGAAGSAIIELLISAGVKQIIAVDSQGIICLTRPGLSDEKQHIAHLTQCNQSGLLDDAVQGADVLIGVSVGKAFTEAHIQSMAESAIVFALANPEPEIMPNLAIMAGAKIVATGRSDFPNQINNVLVFPGLFKGLIEAQKRDLTNDDKVRVAQALSAVVDSPVYNHIIPDVFDKRVVPAVSKAVQGDTIHS
ncbi:MAG: NADP-dependent malic enzyme [bacterium]